MILTFLLLMWHEPLVLKSGTRLECESVIVESDWVLVTIAVGYKSPLASGARRFKIRPEKVDWPATERAKQQTQVSQPRPQKAIVFDQEKLKAYEESSPPRPVNQQQPEADVEAPEESDSQPEVPESAQSGSQPEAVKPLDEAQERKRKSAEERIIKQTLERILSNWRHGKYEAMLQDVHDTTKVYSNEGLKDRMARNTLKPRATRVVDYQTIRFHSNTLVYVTATIHFEPGVAALEESHKRTLTFQVIYEDGGWKYDLLEFTHMN